MAAAAGGLTAAELALDKVRADVYQGWAAMGTGARRGCALEVFDEAAHFIEGESCACPHAAVAGHGGGRTLEGVGHSFFASQLIKDQLDCNREIGIADAGGNGADEVGAFAERFGIEAQEPEAFAILLECCSLHWIKFGDQRFKERL